MASPRRIDTHHHVIPPAWARWLAGHGITAGGGRAIPDWSADATLALMEARGIATAIVSVSAPGVHLGDAIEARETAREVNEFAAALVRQHPGRFGFFATLTLPDVEGALAEAAHALDALGADGVVLLANHAGIYLGDPRFDALFDELNRRGAVVFVHPTELPGDQSASGIAPFVVDFLLDTTRAAIRLASSGTLERCPALRIVLSHAGGFVPYAAYRIAVACSTDGDPRQGLARLRRFYFDTALSGSPAALPSLLAFAAPDHVLFGTDWPYAPAPVIEGFARLYEGYALGDAQRASIDRGAAEQLFPKLRSASPAR